MTTRQDFISKVAECAGPEVIAWTEDNAIALCAWQLAEAGPSVPHHARWNPWDTTLYLPVPGITAFNTFGDGAHVWNYPTELDGIFAFLATLHQPTLGGYGPIRAALVAGDSAASVEQAIAKSAWGTGAFPALVAEVAANPSFYLDQLLPNAY